MAPATKLNERYADPPRIPAATPALEHAEGERRKYIREREGRERRSVLRGLIVLALVVLILSMWRAGADRLFVGRWWWP